MAGLEARLPSRAALAGIAFALRLPANRTSTRPSDPSSPSSVAVRLAVPISIARYGQRHSQPPACTSHSLPRWSDLARPPPEPLARRPADQRLIGGNFARHQPGGCSGAGWTATTDTALFYARGLYGRLRAARRPDRHQAHGSERPRPLKLWPWPEPSPAQRPARGGTVKSHHSYRPNT